MSGGYVGIITVELRFPEAGSLKDKRQYLRSTRAQLQKRFGASVAETAHQDVWQRSQIVVALAASDMSTLEQLTDGVDRYLNGQSYEVLDFERRFVAPRDE